MRSSSRKCPENGPLRNQKPTTFLARHADQRKCWGRAGDLGRRLKRGNLTYAKGCQIGQPAQTLIIATGLDRTPLPCWEPPRSPRASSVGFKEEIRCNFRS